MKVKTVDGVEAIEGRYYYTDSGQVVNLDKILCDQDLNNMFLVTPMYEGEVMGCSGDGGSHWEYTMDYEHEGEPFIVKCIFDSEPLAKLGEKFKIKQKELTDIAIATGSMKSEINDLKVEKKNVQKSIDDITKNNSHLFNENDKFKSMLEITIEEVKSARQKLSELEDACDSLDCDKENKELVALRKTEFKMLCCEHAGIDNWDGYDFAMEKYTERYPNK